MVLPGITGIIGIRILRDNHYYKTVSSPEPISMHT